MQHPQPRVAPWQGEAPVFAIPFMLLLQRRPSRAHHPFVLAASPGLHPRHLDNLQKTVHHERVMNHGYNKASEAITLWVTG